jgi:SAM-dependent methyltransferase
MSRTVPPRQARDPGILYHNHVYYQTHPDRMATLATLFGLEPPPVERCRVLELGCGRGANSIAMAAQLPESVFVGVDLSAPQIAEARALAESLGLRNIDLRAADLRTLGTKLGRFDYIIAHGVYSWVPADARERLMALCGELLTPHGMAYISYNTNPGWRTLSIVRDAMRYRSSAIAEPRARVDTALAALDYLEESIVEGERPTPLSHAIATVRRSLEQAGAERDIVLLHEWLAPVNEPVYFHEFVAHAARHGLQFLTEAEFSARVPPGVASGAAEGARRLSDDLVEREQMVDFVRDTQFRRSILCRAEAPLDRALRPARLMKLFAASQADPLSPAADLRPGVVERFRAANGATLSVDHALSKAALRHMCAIWPKAIVFGDLVEVAGAELPPESWDVEPERDLITLAATLLQAFCYSTRLVSLHTYAPHVAAAAGAFPHAAAIARVLARTGSDVPNVYHDEIALDPLMHYLLPQLDGTRDCATLIEGLLRLVARGAVHIESGPNDDILQVAAAELDGALNRLALSGLLIES